MLGNDGVDLQLVLLDLWHNIVTEKRRELVVLLGCRRIWCGIKLFNGVSGALSWGRNIASEAALRVDGSFGLHRITNYWLIIKGVLICGEGNSRKKHLLFFVSRNPVSLMRWIQQISANFITQICQKTKKKGTRNKRRTQQHLGKNYLSWRSCGGKRLRCLASTAMNDVLPLVFWRCFAFSFLERSGGENIKRTIKSMQWNREKKWACGILFIQRNLVLDR